MELTTQQLQELGRALNKRREALTKETHGGAERAREETFRTLSGSVGDSADDAAADLLADVENAEIGRDVDELRDIEDALERMASRTYGTCIDCRGAIEFERLRACPTAQRCIACQSVHEKTFAHASRATL
jgi:DnaK suppressor protein